MIRGVVCKLKPSTKNLLGQGASRYGEVIGLQQVPGSQSLLTTVFTWKRGPGIFALKKATEGETDPPRWQPEFVQVAVYPSLSPRSPTNFVRTPDFSVLYSTTVRVLGVMWNFYDQLIPEEKKLEKIYML